MVSLSSPMRPLPPALASGGSPCANRKSARPALGTAEHKLSESSQKVDKNLSRPSKSPGRSGQPRRDGSVPGPVPSPPVTFQGTVAAVGLVEGVEFGHVLAGHDEVKDLGVFLNALAMSRLRDHRNVVLEAPAQQHLRGTAAETFCDRIHCLVRQ